MMSMYKSITRVIFWVRSLNIIFNFLDNHYQPNGRINRLYFWKMVFTLNFSKDE